MQPLMVSHVKYMHYNLQKLEDNTRKWTQMVHP